MFRAHHRAALSVLSLIVGCSQSPNGMDEAGVTSRANWVETSSSGEQTPELMSDQLSDVDWANRFFMTQIFDARWNPDGMDKDTESNNCGPASLAMVMTARGGLPADLNAEVAIDHARAMMTPSYPSIDASELLDGTHLYADQALACVDDDTRPVYFDDVQRHASIPHGIEQGGGEAVYGYSWAAMDNMLERTGAVIAHGHITQAWRSRFGGEYGDVGEGPIPHFIGLFPASSEGDVIVSDPMHRGGAVVMPIGDLRSFFKSPINAYDTAIRVVAWMSPESDSSEWTGTVSPGGWKHFDFIEVDEGTLVVTMSGTGDADLYVQGGAEPTTFDWDCRPNAGTSAEECRLDGPGRYFVGVRGYGALSSGYRISYRIEEPASAATDGLEHLKVAAGEWLHFSPIDTDGSSMPVLTMTGDGDADLYARQGSEPTEDDWDCRPYSSNSEEQCRLEGAGTWYFGARGYASSSSRIAVSVTVAKRASAVDAD